MPKFNFNGKSKKAGRMFVAKEIRKLYGKRGYTLKRAIAASLSVARRKGYPIRALKRIR
jgi:hypothetical protein